MESSFPRRPHIGRAVGIDNAAAAAGATESGFSAEAANDDLDYDDSWNAQYIVGVHEEAQRKVYAQPLTLGIVWPARQKPHVQA